VQALTRTVFPVYAPGDRVLAGHLAKLLEHGADVRVFLEEGAIGPGEDILSKAREARTADIIIVLFSRESMALSPSWSRAQWEGPLVTEPADEGVRIAFLRAGECAPPKVLKPQFGRRELRQLKRWVRGHEHWQARAGSLQQVDASVLGDLEALGATIADWPGCETVESAELARLFASEFRQDFDAVLWLECGERSRTELAGDLAAQLGLRLEGPPEENIARLRAFCEPRRLLLVMEDVRSGEAMDLAPGGRCSTLLSTAPAAAAPPDEIRAIQQAVRHMPEPWPDLCARVRQGRRLLQDAGRIAELHEMMLAWLAAAESRGDRRVADESARELIWILESWGWTDDARRLDRYRAAEYEDQMVLPFVNNELS
jgi:hypothetical protein